jgi:TolA-binding protein
VRPRASRLLALATVALAAGTLAGCSGIRRSTPPEPPTLKSLANRQITVTPDRAPVQSNEEVAAKAYRDFLAAQPRDPYRGEALRRLGDLEMDRIDAQIAGDAGASGSAQPDYSQAIARYTEYLKSYPADPRNDRVLYQLARAHELSGRLEVSLATLDDLVTRYPNTAYRNEAQFRRGELLFTLRNYPKAEQAYAITMQAGPSSQYYERSLYMHGWSQFKQAKLENGLQSFFALLDIKLANRGTTPLEKISSLTRADRELIEDTFRVTSISLENLQGAASIPPYIDRPVRREYEFRVVQALAEHYTQKERIKDAADTLAGFAQKNPRHPESPFMQARVIEIYANGGFATLALAAKKQYVEQYGVGSEFQRNNPETWARTEPLVKSNLEELARYHHSVAQKTKKSEDYQEAVRWYRDYLRSFPKDPAAAQNNFLLAELLFEDKRFADAATEYEKSAYAYPAFDKSADAGYAALLAYANQEKLVQPVEREALQRAGVESSLRFAKTFPADARTGAVLTNASERLYALNQHDRAAAVAQQVLARQPAAEPAQRRVAWNVVALTAFEKGAFAEAERATAEVLALTPEKDPGRAQLTERLAAAVYKQGEQARDKGQLQEAVGHFDRVAVVAPGSPVRANAQYDAAAALIALKDWNGAARALEDFRTRYPKHPLQDEVTSKLAVVYVERGSFGQAAAEFERMAGASKDPQLARAGLWQAAEMYEKAGARPQAMRAYERYVKQFPEPLEPALEARYRMAVVARDEGNAARAQSLMREIQRADQQAGAARTDRTRALGGLAALALAEPAVEEYRKVKLVEPLRQNLRVKKERMETALKAYAAASDSGVAEAVTAATFQSAELYRDFGKAMLESQRPRGLKKDELEQYNVLLEEQAFPFEEKAIELHELNAQRAASGVWDRWVRDSYAALAKLRPGRYAKSERGDGVVDAIR